MVTGTLLQTVKPLPKMCLQSTSSCHDLDGFRWFSGCHGDTPHICLVRSATKLIGCYKAQISCPAFLKECRIISMTTQGQSQGLAVLKRERFTKCNPGTAAAPCSEHCAPGGRRGLADCPTRGNCILSTPIHLLKEPLDRASSKHRC